MVVMIPMMIMRSLPKLKGADLLGRNLKLGTYNRTLLIKNLDTTTCNLLMRKMIMVTGVLNRDHRDRKWGERRRPHGRQGAPDGRTSLVWEGGKTKMEIWKRLTIMGEARQGEMQPNMISMMMMIIKGQGPPPEVRAFNMM